MVSVVALVVLALAAGLYWWKEDRSEPPLDSSTEQPVAPPAPTAKRPAVTERAIDGAAASAGAASAALVVQRDAEAGAGAAVGQITVVWHGANHVRWKVLDSRKKVLRDSANSGNTTRSEDLSPGDYVFALDYPEYPPVPVTVRAGRVSEVTPVIGQVIIHWTGDNLLRWKLLDTRKTVVRDAAVASQKSRTEDVLPGEYVVATDYPEYPTYPVTVRAGQAVELTPPVGQVTVNWNGANFARWKLLDASKKVVRDTTIAAQRSRTEDMLPGEYAVVLDYSEYPPYPVSVRDGQATAVAPAVGQIALAWTGTTRLGWKVLDAGKKVVRDTANSANSTVIVDLLPGRYVVIFDYADFPPVPVTVTAGQVSKVAR